MVIGKCTDVFRGIFLVWVELRGEEGAMWEDLLFYVGGICHGGREFNEKGAGFSSIIIKKKQ